MKKLGIVHATLPKLDVKLPTPNIKRVIYFQDYKEVTFEFLDQIFIIEMPIEELYPRWYRVKA